jgi:hypothetical protein
MEFELIVKIAVAVAMPVIVCVMSWAVYAAQTRWEIRREKRFWENRNAWWVEGGVK